MNTPEFDQHWAHLDTVLARATEPSRHLSSRDLLTRVLLMALGLGGVLAALWLMPTRAHADPDDPWDGTAAQMHDAAMVCRWLADDPTETGMVNVVKRMLDHGLSSKTAGDTLRTAVVQICPEYRPLFEQTYNDVMSGRGATVSTLPRGRGVLA
jgi:hypothetical protein